MLSQLVLPVEVPRAHRDPINSATQALSVFSLAITRPLRSETVVLMMNRHHRGVGLFALNDGGDLRTLIDHIVGKCAAENTAHAVAIASVRPRGQSQVHYGSEWSTARNICQRAGLQLVEWFIVSRHGVHCPRIFLNQSEVWHSPN